MIRNTLPRLPNSPQENNKSDKLNMKIVSRSKGKLLFVLFAFFAVAVGKQNLDTFEDSQVTAVCGDNVVLQFTLNSPFEVLSLSWLHNGENLMLHDAPDSNLITKVGRYTSKIETIEINRRCIMLNITSSEYEDAGTYACEIYFQRGFPVFKFWNLQVQGSPEIEIFEDSLKEKQLFPPRCCFYLGLWPDSVSVVWSVDGKFIVEQAAIFHFKSGGKTAVCSYFTTALNRLHHMKVLTCLIRNNLNLSSSFELEVSYSAKVVIEVFTNGVSQPSLITLVEEHDNVSVQCKSDANPRPKVKIELKMAEGRWKRLPVKPNRKLRRGSIMYWTFDMHNFKTNHSPGSYRCTAFNNTDPVGISEERYLLFQREFFCET
ncbi:hypothetical protein HOLleu_03982 [Holothuria leucospilota]|uniref:Ig-like domain-containing protein n=1 Tax=Holothuria leucospilota TaxID=206669 RepID=A0A9Q1HM54_HOLLE|nr:hypothetical protein HOLleu_03982 [Holothuria leucospilota]